MDWQSIRHQFEMRTQALGASLARGLASGARGRFAAIRSVRAPRALAQIATALGAAAPAPGRWLSPEIAAGSLTLNLLSLALPLAILHIYDRVLPNGAFETLTLLAAGVALAFALDAVLRHGRAVLAGWYAAQHEHAMGHEAFGRLIGTDLARFEREPPGVVLDRLGALDALGDYHSGQGILVLLDLPFVLVFVGLIAYIAGPLVAVPIVLLALFAWAATASARRMRAAMEGRAVWDDRRYSFIIEALSGIHTIKSFGMEALFVRRYERLQESCATACTGVTRSAAAAADLGAAFAQVSTVTLAVAGGFLVIDGSLSVGALAATTLLAGRTQQPILRALGLWNNFQSVEVARGRLNALLDLPSESVLNARLPAKPKGRIVFENVSFRYAPEAPFILDGASFAIDEGETVALTGANGGGKTTVAWLMTGIVHPNGGRVLVDGEDLAELDRSAFRRQLAYVPQQTSVFKGTIRDNLLAFAGQGAEESALECARELGLDAYVARLPRGYDTIVGDASAEALPGGVKQRMAIVRALAEPKPALIFDDANANLDARGDRLLRDAIEARKGKMTMVLVTHRPSILKLADRVLALEGRRIVPSRVAVPPMPAGVSEAS